MIDAAAAAKALGKCVRALEGLDRETRAYVLAGLGHVPQILVMEDGGAPLTARQRAARKAANARWGNGAQDA